MTFCKAISFEVSLSTHTYITVGKLHTRATSSRNFYIRIYRFVFKPSSLPGLIRCLLFLRSYLLVSSLDLRSVDAHILQRDKSIIILMLLNVFCINNYF